MALDFRFCRRSRNDSQDVQTFLNVIVYNVRQKTRDLERGFSELVIKEQIYLWRKRCMALFLVLSVWFAAGQGIASAHTSLAGTSPADGEVLEAAPETVELMFSGALSEALSLHTVELAGEGQEAVPLEALVLSEDRKSLSAALPVLANGTYQVAWKVTAADGHALEGRFSFEVAAPEPAEPASAEPGEAEPAAGEPEAESSASAPDEGREGQAGHDGHAAHSGHEGHDGHDGHMGHGGHAGHGSADAHSSSVWVYASRIIYYLTLLPLLGWALWSAVQRLDAERLKDWRRVGAGLQGIHLMAFLVFVAAHWAEMSAGLPGASLMETIRYTPTGQSWLFTLLLSAAGFLLLFRYRAVDGIWTVLMLAAASLRGHSSSFESVVWARIADGIHLGAAALWVGGVLALVLLYRRSREWFRSFAPIFSSAALASFVVLALTGVISVLIYTEQWSDVVRTTWGRLLIAKAVLTVAVIFVAAGLRRKLRRKAEDGSFSFWLRADLLLAAAILVLTALFTHMSPVAERVPVSYHIMGDTVHLTVELPDVQSGTNRVNVKVWVPEGDGMPKVSLLADEHEAVLREEEVPVEPWESFQGFEKYTFSGEVDIADPEHAVVHVQIERTNGEVHKYEQTLADLM